MSPKGKAHADKGLPARFSDQNLDSSRSRTRLVITNVHIAYSDPEEEKKLWDVAIEQGFIQSIQPAQSYLTRRLSLLNWIPGLPQTAIDANGEGLLLPSYALSLAT